MAIGIVRNVGADSFFPAGWKLRTGEFAVSESRFTSNYKVVDGIWRQGGAFEFNNDVIPLSLSIYGKTHCASSNTQGIFGFGVLYNDLNNIAKCDTLLYSSFTNWQTLEVKETKIDLMFRYGLNFDLLQKMKKFEVYGGFGAGYTDYKFKVVAWLERA